MGHRGRPIRRLILAVVLAWGGLSVSACSDDGQPSRIELDEHLYGPGAGLGHGVEVPDGAVRIGPTITILQDRRRAVRQISLLQIDGDPDRTIRALLADLARLLPDADIDPSQSRRRCWLDDNLEWISECRILVGGHTARGRPLQVDVTVTPTADADGEPLPGTTGLPEVRVLVRTDVVRGIGTNLSQPPGFPFRATDQDAARWPVSADAAGSIEAVDTLPGADEWPVQPGGLPIGAVLSGTRYYVVAVEPGEDLQDVAQRYANAVHNEGLSTEPVATVGRRTTMSYEIDSVDGGPGAHLWAVDRPGIDYLFLRYWPTRG
jgi:hypothetical protein